MECAIRTSALDRSSRGQKGGLAQVSSSVSPSVEQGKERPREKQGPLNRRRRD